MLNGIGKDWTRACIVAFTGLAFHLVFLFESSDDPTFYRPIVDAQTYDETARSLALGTYESGDPFWQPPLYPYFLATVYEVSGGSILAARIIQSFLGSITCVLAFLLAQRLFGARTALATGLITAAYGPLIFFNTRLLPAGPATFLNLLFLMLFLRSLDRESRWSAFGSGIVAGLAALTIPNSLVLLVLAALWMTIPAFRSDRPKDIFVRAGCLIAGCILCIAPVTIRNARVSGDFVPISTNGGINLHIGNNADAAGTIAIRPGTDWAYLEREPIRQGAHSAAEANKYFLAKVISYAKGDPSALASGMWHKALQFVNGRELPRNVDLYVHRAYSVLLSITSWRAGFISFPFSILLALGVLGIVTAWKTSKESRFLALGIFLYGASVVLFFVTARYRIVIVPPLAVFAGHGALWLFDHREQRGLLLGGCAVVLATAAVAALPLSAPTDLLDFKAELHLLLGIRDAEEGNFESAVARYEQALALDPEYAAACNYMGVARANQGNAEEAIRWYGKAIEIDPQYGEARNNLGYALAQSGRRIEAIEQYEAALRLRPGLALTHNNLGLELVRLGRAAEAVPHFEKAATYDPEHYEACNNLAWILATHPEAAVRNGNRAVVLAEHVQRRGGAQVTTILDTLAASYAETGRYEEAVNVARRYILWARKARMPEVAQRTEIKLRAYENRKPFRDLSLAAAEEN
jgi:Flp pilus assembly protein TadD